MDEISKAGKLVDWYVRRRGERVCKAKKKTCCEINASLPMTGSFGYFDILSGA